MKFKGVYASGKRFGEIIEFSPAEKVAPALQDAIIVDKKFKDKEHVWIRDVVTSDVSEVKKGNPLDGQFANNIYTAKGTATIHRRSLAKDCLLQPRKYLFEIKFEDCLDPINQPDLNTISLELRDA